MRQTRFALTNYGPFSCMFIKLEFKALSVSHGEHKHIFINAQLKIKKTEQTNPSSTTFRVCMWCYLTRKKISASKSFINDNYIQHSVQLPFLHL